MRSRLVLGLAASVLICAASTAVQAQTSTIRGIHELPRVTPVEPPAETTPAPAEPDSSATTIESVTVEAKRLTRPEVEQRSRSFVLTYATPTAKLDQFARWRDPICVVVDGDLSPEMAAKIKTRIEGVAKTLGVRIVRPSCAANIEILFSRRPQYWLDWIAAHREAALGYHTVPQIKALKSVVRSVQAWYVTSTHADGGVTATVMGAGINGYAPQNETVDNIEGMSPPGCAYSRLTSCLESVFTNVLVFVDSGDLKDRELGPLADYLAMMTLSQPRSLDGCAAFPSVIDYLAPNCSNRAAPEGLTSADRAYLQALYTANLEARRSSQETDIAGRMAAGLIKAESR
jgi:hypothetical protein